MWYTHWHLPKIAYRLPKVKCNLCIKNTSWHAMYQNPQTTLWDIAVLLQPKEIHAPKLLCEILQFYPKYDFLKTIKYPFVKYHIITWLLINWQLHNWSVTIHDWVQEWHENVCECHDYLSSASEEPPAKTQSVCEFHITCHIILWALWRGTMMGLYHVYYIHV